VSLTVPRPALGRLAESAFDRLWQAARRGWVWLAVGAGGLLLGSQIYSPNQRVWQVLGAVALSLGALRVESVVGLLMLIPLLPFPKITTYGSTNVAFVILIFVMWLARVVLRLEKAGGRSRLDLPALLLAMAYLLSFSQIEDPEIVRPALTNFWRALTYMALCYLVIHLVREERNLRRVVTAIVVMGVLVQLTAVFELFFPDRALIPGWIDLSLGRRLVYIQEGLEITNLRVGGAIGDYELLAEFCALLLLLELFLFAQTAGGRKRFLLGGLLALTGFVLLATVTRGAIVSLAVAGGFLLWVTRRHLRFHRVALAGAAAFLVAALLLDVVAQHTRSGNVLERFAGTEIHGLVPDTRQQVWSDAWERVWESPLLGHGPYYTGRVGVRQFYWPHNNYLLYWYLIGFLGLAAFLFILYRLWRETGRHADRLDHPSYTRGLLLALRAMLVLFVIDQVKIDYLRNESYSFWVWLFFGLVVAAGRLARQEAEGVVPAAAPARAASGRSLLRVSPAPAVPREAAPGA
jgi:O-antigen ligase